MSKTPPLFFPLLIIFPDLLPVFIVFHYSPPLFPNFRSVGLWTPLSQSNQIVCNGFECPFLWRASLAHSSIPVCIERAKVYRLSFLLIVLQLLYLFV